tara:strand:+ start:21 stop:482 length:462 start_codon:yes stop_codon:yes gene_type:complete
MRGEHRRIMEENLREAKQAAIRDRSEKDALVFRQVAARRELAKDRSVQRSALDQQRQEIQRDTQVYLDMRAEWRARINPPTGPTVERAKPLRRMKDTPTSKKEQTSDVAHLEPQKNVTPRRDFETAARDERREAFRELRARIQTHERGPLRNR